MDFLATHRSAAKRPIGAWGNGVQFSNYLGFAPQAVTIRASGTKTRQSKAQLQNSRFGFSPSWVSTDDVTKIRDFVSSGGSVLTLGHGMTYDWGIGNPPSRSLSEEIANRFPARHHGPSNAYQTPEGSFVNTKFAAAGDGIIDGSFGQVSTVSSTQ